ncbi:hypothetical protein NDU88_006528 [Pleurodeles waltl]|uniref:Uncharacterized protein n=1 Tax=Pleurodeles waltl TaxID=8319 RepID=A0AAV7VPD0_PLEWA|nr:hypothetical protein NDU88_006528 [Pleurodeles waltl]
MRVLSDQALLSAQSLKLPVRLGACNMRSHEGQLLRWCIRRPRPPRWCPSVPARRAQPLRPPGRSAPRRVCFLVSVRAPSEPLRQSGQVSGVSGYY